MRLGIVRGRVTLSPAIPALTGKTLVVVEPITTANLVERNGLAGGRSLVAVDALGAAEGQMVAFTEGREAANPFWPALIPVDAYCTLIVDSITTGTTQNYTDEKSEVSK
jgi:microcompartment protein CcmK/EutM